MRFAIAVAILVAIGNMASAQKTKDGLPQSRYASPKVHRSSSAAPIAPRANAHAAELTKIEQQGARAQMQSAKRSPSPSRLPSLAQAKNKPIRFAKSRPSSNTSSSARSTGGSSRAVKLH